VLEKPDLNEALEVLLACIKGRMIRGTGEYPGPTKIKAALAALEGAVVLDAETWREAREVARLLCEAAFVTDHSFVCPPAFEESVRAARAILAAHPLEDKP
jgi:hypothetical protein